MIFSVYGLLISGCLGISLYWSVNGLSTLIISSVFLSVAGVSTSSLLGVVLSVFPTSLRQVSKLLYIFTLSIFCKIF